MSRCYPYPPPGYTPSRAGKEALIESIKLQKEKPKSQKNKEKSREKEDERKMRKDERYKIREKTSEKTDPNSKKRRKREEGREEKKRRRKERNEKPDMNTKKLDFPNGQSGKTIWENREQLEGSGLTEEHDQPVLLNLPSTSSESTETSSKRKMQSSPIKVIRGHGNIIRIQLSSKKKNLSDIPVDELQLCSTSGRTDVIPPLRSGQTNFCPSTEKTGNFVQGDIKRTDLKQLISASGKSGLDAAPASRTPSVLDVIEGSKQSSGSKQYKNLIENWVPPSLQDAPFSPEDLDWLFCCTDQGLRSERRQKFENDSVFCASGSSLLPPRAQFLPEVDVYVLPYTVPY